MVLNEFTCRSWYLYFDIRIYVYKFVYCFLYVFFFLLRVLYFDCRIKVVALCFFALVFVFPGKILSSCLESKTQYQCYLAYFK